ncbi:MAG: DNA polymerase III subunit chi [Pseudomonadota bacterium]
MSAPPDASAGPATRIDYYVLADGARGTAQHLACRIAGKAHALGHTIYLHTNSAAEARELDALLWTFSETSFVPHALASGLDDERALARTPVRIGHGAAPGASAELLINLAADVPDFFTRFDRVAEVVDTDEGRRARGRARYREYRERGYAIDMHTIER